MGNEEYAVEEQIAPRRTVVLILLAHVCLVPTAVLGTRLALGFEDALTLANQSTWVPIILAQSSMLCLYLGLGTGKPLSRLTLFFGGMSFVMASVIWARSMLVNIPDFSFIVADLRTISVWLLLPQLCVAATLLPVKALIGHIHAGDLPRSEKPQFHIRDLVGVTCLVAVGLGWFRTATTQGLTSVIDYTGLPFEIAAESAGLTGAAILLFAAKWRSIGLFVVAAAAVTQAMIHQPAGFTAWIFVAYNWFVVLTTLFVFRAAGYRLTGGLLVCRSVPQVSRITTG